MNKKLKVFFVIFFASLLLVCGCGADHTGEAKIPKDSSDCKHKNYKVIEGLFESAGFTNIRLEAIEDLIFGWVTKDGEVDMVVVGGKEEFYTWNWFNSNTEVIIYYHTFPNSNKEEKETETKIESDSNGNQDISDGNTSSNSSSSNSHTGGSSSNSSPSSSSSSSNSGTNSVAESNPSSNIPRMNGTSVETVTSKASGFGLGEVSDMDFGNNTRCVELADSSGGLMLTVIYSSSNSEILCATIVTNNLASSDSQISFIKGMASVLCPTSDKDEVVDWVNSNIGNEAYTVISGRTYTLEYGAVNNILFYAGYDEWEVWDLNQ